MTLVEDEARMATELLARGEAAHAAHHAANAFGNAPGREDVAALLERTLARSDGTFLANHANHFAQLAGHGIELLRNGSTRDGLQLLVEVAEFRRDLPFEVPLVREMSRLPASPGQLPTHALLSLFIAPSKTNAGRMRLRSSEVRYAARVATVADAVHGHVDLSPTMWAFMSGVYRRAGRLSEALEAATRAVAEEDSNTTHVMKAFVHRMRREFEPAIMEFRAAAAAAGDPGGTDADVARVLWDAGEVEEALATFKRVDAAGDAELMASCDVLEGRLGLKPRGPAGWFGRTALSDSAQRGNRIRGEIGSEPTADDIRLFPYAFSGFVPEPMDASINTLREIAQKQELRGAKLSISCSHIEAPSARLAMAHALRGDDAIEALASTFSSVPEPDPRVPRGDVSFAVWVHDEASIPRPGLPMPSPPLRARIATLAESSVFLPRLWRESKEIGRHADPQELAALMCHPGVHSTIPPWSWIPRMQLVAAFAIAHTDSGWEDSARRSVLLTLLHGPLDWSVDATIVALTELALDEPDALAEIRHELVDLKRTAPEEGHLCWGSAWAHAMLRLPGTPKDLVGEAEAWLAQD